MKLDDCDKDSVGCSLPPALTCCIRRRRCENSPCNSINFTNVHNRGNIMWAPNSIFSLACIIIFTLLSTNWCTTGAQAAPWPESQPKIGMVTQLSRLRLYHITVSNRNLKRKPSLVKATAVFLLSTISYASNERSRVDKKNWKQ